MPTFLCANHGVEFVRTEPGKLPWCAACAAEFDAALQRLDYEQQQARDLEDYKGE